MADAVTGLPGRGNTFLTGPNRTAPTTYGNSVLLEGTKKNFKDVTPGTVGMHTLRSGLEVQCILVRNTSTIALLPKRVVKFAAGYRNQRVDAYCRLDSESVAGVVDEYLPATGVPVNDLFWLVVKGPCLVKTSLGGDVTNFIAEGDPLVALTAATTGATTAGRIQPFAITSNATFAASGAMNLLGRAMSARATTQTNADVLCDLRIA